MCGGGGRVGGRGGEGEATPGGDVSGCGRVVGLERGQGAAGSCQGRGEHTTYAHAGLPPPMPHPNAPTPFPPPLPSSYTLYAKHKVWGKVVGEAGEAVLQLETSRTISREMSLREAGGEREGPCMLLLLLLMLLLLLLVLVLAL